jgi:hypothetical protein
MPPDFQWYSSESKRLGLPHFRCPFANLHACPRFFESRSLLGKAGSTPISPETEKQLDAKWKHHPLSPQTKEDAPGLSGDGEKIFGFHNFCPEILGERFGMFATYLGRYTTEEDRDNAQKRLTTAGADPDDPHWDWSGYRRQHYSECPLYSPLSHDWVKHITRPILASAGASAAPSVRFDVFISHASEDKDEFVRPLAASLTSLGLKVWYDEWTLTIGDSLRQKIDQGLANSDFGVVVLSRHFFSKEWPQAELDGLFAKEMVGKKVILPVWHDITKEEVLKYSPLLAGKLGTKTAKGVLKVAQEVFDVVRSDAKTKAPPRLTTTSDIPVTKLPPEDRKFYTDITSKVVKGCMLKRWDDIQPQITLSPATWSRKLIDDVRQLQDMILRAIWPKKLSVLETALKNVVFSFTHSIQILERHCEYEGESCKGRFFYKDHGHNPNYDRDLEKFNEWNTEYDASIFELLRAINWFCDVVREHLDPKFLRNHGYFSRNYGERAPQYDSAQKMALVMQSTLERVGRSH